MKVSLEKYNFVYERSIISIATTWLMFHVASNKCTAVNEGNLIMLMKNIAVNSIQQMIRYSTWHFFYYNLSSCSGG